VTKTGNISLKNVVICCLVGRYRIVPAPALVSVQIFEMKRTYQKPDFGKKLRFYVRFAVFNKR